MYNSQLQWQHLSYLSAEVITMMAFPFADEIEIILIIWNTLKVFEFLKVVSFLRQYKIVQFYFYLKSALPFTKIAKFWTLQRCYILTISAERYPSFSLQTVANFLLVL